MMNDNVLSLRNVTFGFAGVQRPLFYNVNVSFATGKIHVIRGRNGVGKSTLFRILQGQVYPGEQFSGSLYLDNRKYDERALKKCELKDMLQLVPQKFDCALADECSFDQNLALAQIPYLPRLTGLPKKQVVPDFIERFGIDVNKPVKQLSGGQRQILAIVMALQKSRKILLLDSVGAATEKKCLAVAYGTKKYEQCKKKRLKQLLLFPLIGFKKNELNELARRFKCMPMSTQ